jgi:Methyltransferase domain
MIGLRRFANAENPTSFSNWMRAKRFRLFEKLVEPLARPLRIIDVGGTIEFWENRGWADREDVQITTVNLFAEEQRHANIEPRVGDATSLVDVADQSFDVAFSNSVIEHLYTLDAQLAMAREVCRVACAYWIQTPNYWFPMEPHFHVPGWQWLPESLRIWTIRRKRCGWRGPCADPVRARELVREVRLMTRRELARAFPNGTIVSERFGGLVKSWIVVGGGIFLESRAAQEMVAKGSVE